MITLNMVNYKMCATIPIDTNSSTRKCLKSIFSNMADQQLHLLRLNVYLNDYIVNLLQ